MMIRLHLMHEMLTIVTDVRGVCLSVCLWRGLNRRRRVQCTPRSCARGHSVQPSPNAFGLLLFCYYAEAAHRPTLIHTMYKRNTIKSNLLEESRTILEFSQQMSTKCLHIQLHSRLELEYNTSIPSIMRSRKYIEMNFLTNLYLLFTNKVA